MIYCNRRDLLKYFSLGGFALAVNPLQTFANPLTSSRPLPTGKDAENFIIHNELPWALETHRSRFGIAPITPQSAFFVRNNLPTPAESIVEHRDQWRFEVAGTVEAGSLTLAELKTMPVHIVATVMQCSGNGRAFFDHHPSGSPWTVGAAGCALWTGVRVGDIIDRFGGATDDAVFLTTTGADPLPEGIDRNQVVVERSIPLEKGLRDCLLVWEMNGAPLPLVHGGPLRLIVPGYYGVNNIKWVKRLALTQEQSGAHIQQSGYRIRPIGTGGGPDHPSMWRMNVKSWLNGPGAEGTLVKSGPVLLHGVAFSGERAINKVDISNDEGHSWQQAQLVGPDLGPNAWRSFVYQTDLKPGEYHFASRATDTEGDSQPRESEPNERGYGHNGWLDATLSMMVVEELPIEETASSSTVAASAAAATVAPKRVELSPLAQQGRSIFLEKAQPSCGVCHQLADAGTQGAVGPNLNTLQPSLEQVTQAVTHGVGAMPAFGAQLSQQELEALAAYVSEASIH